MIDVRDVLRLKGFSQIQLATGGTATQTAQLEPGTYVIWSGSVDIYIKQAAQGIDANDVTTSTGYLMPANTIDMIAVDIGDKIGAVAASSTTLSLHRIG